MTTQEPLTDEEREAFEALLAAEAHRPERLAQHYVTAVVSGHRTEFIHCGSLEEASAQAIQAIERPHRLVRVYEFNGGNVSQIEDLQP